MTVEAYSSRRDRPFTASVILVANAVAELRLVIDGPDCIRSAPPPA